MRRYYLHTRHNGVIYAELVDPQTGAKLHARSTGTKNRDEALLKISEWLKSGIPTGRARKPRPPEAAAGIENILKAIRRTEISSDDALRIVRVLKDRELIDIAAVKNTGRGAVPFVRFLETFWDYEKSEYIQDKLAHGYRFSRRYAYECGMRLTKNIKPFFGDMKLNCVTADDLKKLSGQLTERGLATSTKNQFLLMCCTPLKWAFNEKIIPTDPTVGLTKFSIINKERGILTEAETAAVFTVDWKDKRAFVASLVAATTGARLGECLALRQTDIGEDTLTIAHSYSRIDGLKCPKNGHKRIAPLLPEVRAALLDLLKDNPHNAGDPFVFYSMFPSQPVDYKVISKGLKEAIETVNAEYKKAAEKTNLEKPEIQIDYKSRNICFHSWRHWFCSKITEIIDGEKVAKVSGHLTEAVFKKYAGHIEAKNIQEVGTAAARAFGNVLQFRKGA
jgi:integrase